MRRLSVVLLVDARGWVLLQERDEHAPLAPEKWGMVGGHVEDGEDFEAAAYRELEEETGVCLDGGLRLWRDERFGHSGQDELGHYQLRVAPTTLTDADIVVGEGRQIVFVNPGDVARLDKSETCAHFLPQFLASRTYGQLVAELSG